MKGSGRVPEMDPRMEWVRMQRDARGVGRHRRAQDQSGVIRFDRECHKCIQLRQIQHVTGNFNAEFHTKLVRNKCLICTF